MTPVRQISAPLHQQQTFTIWSQPHKPGIFGEKGEKIREREKKLH